MCLHPPLAWSFPHSTVFSYLHTFSLSVATSTFKMIPILKLAPLLFSSALVTAQSAEIRETVGPLSSIPDKTSVKVCDITDYGAQADGATDISSALNDAFTDCSAGGVVVVPSGDYALATG